jgi:endonuclease/exonuclease/phosphatase family metal-dependent hydrolase
MRLRIAATIACSALLTSLCSALPAQARTSLGTPSGERLLSATSTSFTIGTARAAYATAYRMYVSTAKSGVYVANITSHTKNAVSHTPRITVTGLKYTSATVYYRVETLRGKSHRWGAVRATGLKPSAPSSVQATPSSTGLSLTWPAQAAAGFLVTQATSPDMKANRTSYKINGQHYAFTPYRVTAGRQYYFQVRADNTGTLSSYSPVTAAAPSTHLQPVRLLTYNLLENTFDGTRESGSIVSPWSKRRVNAAKLIRQANPDIIDIEEGAAWVGHIHGFGGTRQVDDLRKLLPGYSLARTEIPPTEHGYRRTGNYILYRSSAYRTVGAGDNWILDGPRTAAYQELQNRSSGAKVLVVAPHVVAGNGAARDKLRQVETTKVVSSATRLASGLGVPVVYGGDFNSTPDKHHAFDGPALVMRANRIVDAHDVAPRCYNNQFNSANQYLRKPPAFGDRIDHIFTSRGIGVVSWGLVIDLKGGKFVGTIPSDHNPIWAELEIPF